MLETLTVYVGAATAKAILKCWLKDEAILGDVGADVVDLVKAKVPGFIERRRTQGLLDRFAEEVAQRLEPFYKVEFSGLPDNEMKAAAIAVASTVEKARIDLGLLLDKNLQPMLLEAHLRHEDPTAAADAYLSEAATGLYDVTLREACNYISEIAKTLPDFHEAVLVESLRREDEILDLVRRILDNLPSTLGSLAEVESDAVRFEDQYRKEAARVLDRLTLFGVGESEASQRYALSVAYISLSAVVDDSEGDKEGRQEDDEDDYVRVEDALAASDRAVVRGQAGSGKTTLLQWLAVNSAKGGFEGSLSRLNGTIPFFIQLRRYVDAELPSPPQFIEHVSTVLAGMLPDQWVERALEEGRALVLVDGVDELPEGQRQALHDWLTSLCAVFPNSKYFVTSRPAAIENQWLRDEGFGQTELQPMDMGDVQAFIRHWHRAAIQQVADEGDREDLLALRDRLDKEVRRSPGVRALASAPLLCAVLCTLNRARRNLPTDRIELYNLALDLLLDTRDSARDLRVPDEVDLQLRQKKALVRDLAYWLILNNHSDITRARAHELLGRKLTQLDVGPVAPEVVFKYLMVRSGLLREPVEGRIDFIHRTFQEFLAADEALELDHVGVLLEHADLAEWREVVILAAGLARTRQREELLLGLLNLGNEDEDKRHRLHLLAVACLETAPILEVDLRDQVTKALEKLVPPTNLTEAAALASAGSLAVPLLTGFRGENAPIAKACVRTLASIGSEEALEALTNYAGDSRVTVQKELVRAWSYFDPQRFAEVVLASTELRSQVVKIDDSRQLAAAALISGEVELRAKLAGEEVDLGPCAALPNLTRLEVKDSSIADLEPLRDHQGLKLLTLTRCFGIGNLEPLANITSLRRVGLEMCDGVEDLSPLATTGVEALHAVAVPRLDVNSVGGISSLKDLSLTTCSVSDATPLKDLTGLRRLDLRGNPIASLAPLHLEQCRRLMVSDTGVEVLPDSGLAGMVRLWASRTALVDLSALSDARHLERVVLIDCAHLSDIQALGDKPALTYVDLERCAGVNDISPLASVSALNWLDISGTSVQDLSPLFGLSDLKTVRLGGLENAVIDQFRQKRPDVAVNTYWWGGGVDDDIPF